MSERQEHKRRYNRRLEFISHSQNWLDCEPPMVLIFHWWRWKKQRPVWEDDEE